MAEIQQFNLGQLLGQAEAIKGARRQNQLAELMAPIQQQSAQLGLDQARLGQTQQLARGALSILGDAPEQNWGQAIEFVRSRGGDVTGIEQYSPQNYALAQQLATGGAGRRIQSTYVDGEGNRVAVYTDGTVNILGRAGTNKRMVDGVLVDTVTGEAVGVGGGDTLTDDEIRARQQAEARRQADAAAGVKGAEEAAKADVRLRTGPEIESRVAEARRLATLQAEKQFGQQGQQNRLEDFDTAYNLLKNADLDVIYGRGEAWVPEYLRSQKGIDLIARRNQIVGMLKLGARGELKGQGQITEGEQGILGQAITVLENPNISPELASKALDEARSVLYKNAGQQAPTAGGMTAEQARQAGWQLMTDANGNRAYVGPNNQIVEVQ